MKELWLDFRGWLWWKRWKIQRWFRMAFCKHEWGPQPWNEWKLPGHEQEKCRKCRGYRIIRSAPAERS